MTKDELVEKAKAEVIEMMGPIFGSPEYLADPVKLARAEKRREDAASAYVNCILAIAMPAAFEMAVEVVIGSNADLTGDAGTAYRKCVEAIRAEGEKWK